jgi:hypothetical protein
MSAETNPSGRVRFEPVAVPSTVAACFYGELRSTRGLQHTSGAAAFVFWLSTIGRLCGVEPESARLRQDLEELGAEEFSRCWETLVRFVECEGIEHVFASLDQHYAAHVSAGLERRERRTGQA